MLQIPRTFLTNSYCYCQPKISISKCKRCALLYWIIFFSLSEALRLPSVINFEFIVFKSLFYLLVWSKNETSVESHYALHKYSWIGWPLIRSPFFHFIQLNLYIQLSWIWRLVTIIQRLTMVPLHDEEEVATEKLYREIIRDPFHQ